MRRININYFTNLRIDCYFPKIRDNKFNFSKKIFKKKKRILKRNEKKMSGFDF